LFYPNDSCSPFYWKKHQKPEDNQQTGVSTANGFLESND
jgi:hypothetical protein